MRACSAAMPEILAPAGNQQALEAAVRAGADAVYLGLTDFNARRTAGNFDAAALQEAAAFCRARGVKCYLTFNTELMEGELARACEALRAADAAGVDAVIVQDLATAALVRRYVPGAALHASTQMSVHSPAGIRQLARLGFSRAILAREMSLSGRAQRQPRAVCRPVPPAVFGRAAPARRRFSPQLKRPFPPGPPARPARGGHCQCKNRGAPARPGICGGRGGRMRGRARGAAL